MRRWALLYGCTLVSALTVLAALNAWAGFWIVAFVGVWVGSWLAFSAFWRWAEETRTFLLRRRGYY